MTERLHFHFSLSCIGEGNGNPLQCSCLESPRDRGPWWAAVSGVAQSRTWLKGLSIVLLEGRRNVPIFRRCILKFSGVRCSNVWNLTEEKIEENTVCGAAYWQGTHEALPFLRELLCSHALQSHVTPTQGRLVQRLQTLAWGPEFCSRFLIWWPEPLLCVLALAFLLEVQLGAHRQPVRMLFHTLNSLFPTGSEAEREAWVMAEPSQVQLTGFSGRLTSW